MFVVSVVFLCLQETYSYFSLPFCPGPKTRISHYHETLGENLLGIELQFLGVDIRFKSAFANLPHCNIAMKSYIKNVFFFTEESRIY